MSQKANCPPISKKCFKKNLKNSMNWAQITIKEPMGSIYCNWTPE
tara:strand:+ start:337 stop:471 length:135 start_codon:yes stop_codon:yes gene_type:complete